MSVDLDVDTIKAKICAAWRAKRLAEMEHRTDTAESLGRRIDALLDCLPRG